MVGTAHIVGTLILLSFIRTGVDGGDNLIFAKGGYDIYLPCEEDIHVVCFHMWKLSGSQSPIAIVSNGEILRVRPEDDRCTLRGEPLTTEDVGRHRCHERSNNFSAKTLISAPELKLLPGKPVSLQCVLLAFVENAHCLNSGDQLISLTWVDETGAEIQDNAQHQITHRSHCDVTLTVAFQSPKSLKFRCRATVNGRVLTSVELLVRAPAPNRKGRGLGTELEPGTQGRNHGTTGAAVGVASCVVLAVAVAVFVLHRRRTNNQLPNGSCSDE